MRARLTRIKSNRVAASEVYVSRRPFPYESLAATLLEIVSNTQVKRQIYLPCPFSEKMDCWAFFLFLFRKNSS